MAKGKLFALEPLGRRPLRPTRRSLEGVLGDPLLEPFAQAGGGVLFPDAPYLRPV
jgi:hypothetical protein